MNRILLNVHPDDLHAAGEAARRLNVSRAEILRRGLRLYLDAIQRQAEEERRRHRVAAVIADMDKMATQERDPGWKPGEITRAWRNRARDPR